MKCKKCGAPLEDAERICPQCGQDQDAACDTAESEAAEPVTDAAQQDAPDAAAAAEAAESADTEAAETAAPEEAAEDNAPETEDKTAAAPKKGSKTAMICLLAVLAVAVVVLVVLLARGRKNDVPADAAGMADSSGTADDSADSADDAESAEETNTANVSYVHDNADDFTDEVLNTVVASCADSELTNSTLAYYYWREFYSMVSSYSSYLSYFMDPYARLDTQLAEEGRSWDQVMMDNAFTTFHVCSAASARAKEDGFTLAEEDQSVLDTLEETIAGYAQQYGFDSADDYLKDSFGPYCTMETYREYMEQYFLASSYLAAQIDGLEIDEQTLSDYYDENAEKYEADGLVKDDTCMVNVRHILIQPEAVDLKEGDEGYEEAVQAAKDAAREKAEALYQQWLDGDATEESFAALAQENSQDGGSAANGGLYENVYPGQTVTEFNDWCFDPARQNGDSGIVETSYGYHIMFFVSTGDTPYWQSVVTDDYRTSRYNALCDELVAAYPMEENREQAMIYPCNVTAATAAEGDAAAE